MQSNNLSRGQIDALVLHVSSVMMMDIRITMHCNRFYTLEQLQRDETQNIFLEKGIVLLEISAVFAANYFITSKSGLLRLKKTIRLINLEGWQM